MKKVFYYSSYEDDVVKSKNQEYKLKANYKWIHKNIFYKVISFFLYLIFYIISFIYSKFILHITVKNKNLLKGKKDFFIYGNHTQEVGDAFNPPLITFPYKPYFIVSKSNLGIPILGKLLPMLGALVIPDEIHAMMEFRKAVTFYNKNHPIIIYPEAHVWPYYTKIRPFKSGSFQFPVEEKKEVFTMTTTYQRSKWHKKPNITIFIDGPFLPCEEYSKKEKIKDLEKQVEDAMNKRVKLSNYEFIAYEKRD